MSSLIAKSKVAATAKQSVYASSMPSLRMLVTVEILSILLVAGDPMQHDVVSQKKANFCSVFLR